MFDFFDFIGDFVHAVKAIVTGDVSMLDISDYYIFIARRYITTALTDFISSSRSSFVEQGQKIFHSFDVDNSLNFFSFNFVFWVVGFFIGFFILKYLISIIVDFISRFLDIT